MNFVGYSCSLVHYQKAHGISGFDVRESLPHLDALVDLIEDWLAAGFQRSAFQEVMWNLDQRFCTITDEIIPIEQAPAISVESLAETVMKICELENDLSFVFSILKRDQRVGKEWRPSPGVIHSILP